jgi:hypothetical protein
MADPNIKQAIEAWVNVDSVDTSSSVSIPEVSKADTATVRGNFLGEDESDEAAEGVAIYSETQNLPTAVASLLNHSQNRANFHPASMTAKELALAFRNYAIEIDKNPFLYLSKTSIDKQSYKSKDYNVLIDRVVNLYEGLESVDLDEIKDSIANMGKSLLSHQTTEDSMNLFAQSTIGMSDPGNPKFMIYYTTLRMKNVKNGKSEVLEQEYEVNRTSYFVLPDLIKAHAASLAKLQKTTIDDWAINSTSPEREDAKLCFEVKQYSMSR